MEDALTPLDTSSLVHKALLVHLALLQLFVLDLLAVLFQLALLLGSFRLLDTLRLFDQLGAHALHVFVRLDHLGIVVGWPGEGDGVLRAEGFGLGDGFEGYFVAIASVWLTDYVDARSVVLEPSYGHPRTRRFHAGDLLRQYCTIDYKSIEAIWQ